MRAVACVTRLPAACAATAAAAASCRPRRALAGPPRSVGRILRPPPPYFHLGFRRHSKRCHPRNERRYNVVMKDAHLIPEAVAHCSTNPPLTERPSPPGPLTSTLPPPLRQGSPGRTADLPPWPHTPGPLRAPLRAPGRRRRTATSPCTCGKCAPATTARSVFCAAFEGWPFLRFRSGPASFLSIRGVRT